MSIILLLFFLFQFILQYYDDNIIKYNTYTTRVYRCEPT